jgi:ABC-type multidrug transport system fused ATPase/permease subunit
MVLKDIMLEAQKGQTVAVVGRTGSGKSTLVNLLPRFFDCTSGRVAIDGTDIRNVTFASLRGQIGLVSQDSVVFYDTFANNIAYGMPGATREQIEQSAQSAYADEFIVTAPQGYDTMVEEGGRNLSGGQRQRLCLARAICKDPAILILDEATSALDTHSEALIQKALVEFMKGRTTFVIAHRLSTVEHADKIVVLDQGRIDAVGTHVQLLETCQIYRRLHSRRFEDD